MLPISLYRKLLWTCLECGGQSARGHSNVGALSLILAKLSEGSYRRAGLSTSFNELTKGFLARS